jgi:hypothetical protein
MLSRSGPKNVNGGGGALVGGSIVEKADFFLFSLSFFVMTSHILRIPTLMASRFLRTWLTARTATVMTTTTLEVRGGKEKQGR